MKAFLPPCCPRSGCEHHLQSPGFRYQAYKPWGAYATKAFGPVPRFRCTACGKTFSSQTFSVDYYAKRVVDCEALAGRLSSCECLRAMGRALGLSSESVPKRIARAARQALAAEPRASLKLWTDEKADYARALEAEPALPGELPRPGAAEGPPRARARDG